MATYFGDGGNRKGIVPCLEKIDVNRIWRTLDIFSGALPFSAPAWISATLEFLPIVAEPVLPRMHFFFFSSYG